MKSVIIRSLAKKGMVCGDKTTTDLQQEKQEEKKSRGFQIDPQL